ncbi:ATP-binding protein [Streptomyces sp. NPDC047981]|uniref:ATP-binding protein n=1 Tax=Streptomyces sp. NPDC047981 TaxID=3154610 RepID=UPI00344696A5
MNQKSPAQLLSQSPHFGVLLSPTPRGARLARLLAVEWLRTKPELPYRVVENAEHVVAELATNAATHGRVAGRNLRLALIAQEETLRIEVTDTRDDALPRLRPPDGESGRGLLLVDALADRWGVDLGPVPCKTVWAELDLRLSPPSPSAVPCPVPGPPGPGV